MALNIISLFTKEKDFGIKRKIIPIMDINRDKIRCLNNSLFNIILEKKGNNKK